MNSSDEKVLSPWDPMTDPWNLQLFAEGDEGGEGGEGEGEPEDEALDFEEFGLADDEGEGGGESEPDPKLEAVKAKARADALEAENVRINAALAEERARQQQILPQPRQEQEYQPQPRRKLKDLVPKDFKATFISDADKAMEVLFDVLDQEIDARTADSSRSPAINQVDAAVNEFLRDKRDSDPEEYAIAVKHFREIADKTPDAAKVMYSRAPRTQLLNALEQTWDSAVGKGERQKRIDAKKSATQRQGAPPPSSGARSRTGGGGAVGGGDRSRFTAVERAMIEGGKAAGLSKRDIEDIIKEHRQEQRALGA